MSFNVSMGGGSAVPPKPSSEQFKQESTTLESLNVTTTPVNLNNSHELRQAELQGENITISDAQVVKAIEHAIKAMQGRSTSLEFSIHQKTKLIAVKVLDKDTGETIREIPPEKSLDFVAKLWQMAGILVDEKR